MSVPRLTRKEDQLDNGLFNTYPFIGVNRVYGEAHLTCHHKYWEIAGNGPSGWRGFSRGLWRSRGKLSCLRTLWPRRKWDVWFGTSLKNRSWPGGRSWDLCEGSGLWHLRGKLLEGELRGLCIFSMGRIRRGSIRGMYIDQLCWTARSDPEGMLIGFSEPVRGEW